MAPSENIFLRESMPPSVHEPDRTDAEQDTFDIGQDDWSQWESHRKRAYVLVGSAVLQMPIWGKLISYVLATSSLIHIGFVMSYGVFQEYYSSNGINLQGNHEITGIIGTTSNGVMYLSMPLLFALFTSCWARWRQTAAWCGALLTCISFLLSSFSTDV